MLVLKRKSDDLCSVLELFGASVVTYIWSYMYRITDKYVKASI